MKVFGTKDRRYAAKKASVLKRKKEIREYTEAALEKLRTEAMVDAKKVLELLASVAFTSPASFAYIAEENGKQKIVWKDIEKIPEDVKRAIAVMKNTPSGVAIETLDRMKAIDLLMKYMGISSDGGGVYFEGEGEIE